jgi:hypothetical protein
MRSDQIKGIQDFIDDFGLVNKVAEDERACRFAEIKSITEDHIGKLKKLKSILSDVCAVNISGNIDGDIDIENLKIEQLRGQELSISFQKKLPEGELFFFTISAFKNYLTNVTTLARKIIILRDFVEFYTYGLVITNSFDKKNEHDKWEGIVDGKKVVSNYCENRIVICDISQWLITKKGEDDCLVYKIFLQIASEKLFYLLANEIFVENSKIYLSFVSDRKICIEVNAVNNVIETCVQDLFLIQKCIKWIFESTNEYETRHTLLNYQIAIDIDNSNIDLNKLSISLSNAKNAYSYFLVKKSKDMIKSLSELKRSISTELSEHNKNTYNIIKNLWRDLMFAAVALAYDIFNSKNHSDVSNVIPIFVACGISVSFLMSIFSEIKYQRITSKNMNTWYPQLYSFLIPSDMNKLINEPIKKIKNSLWIVIGICCVIYIVVDSLILRNTIPLLSFIKF